MLFMLAVGLAGLASGQVNALTPPGPTPDNGWSQLKQLEQTAGAVGPRNTAGVSGGPATQVASDYVARAKDLEDFQTKHPGDARTSEARRLEAEMLVYAGYFGDTADQPRADALVAQVLVDATLPVEDRFALASLAEFQSVRLQQFATEKARMQKFEQVARTLITKFPAAPQAYETLLLVAKDCPDDQAAGIARDLLAMNSSAPVKGGAQGLLDRYALLGQSLAAHLTAQLAVKDRPTLVKNKIVILYPWAVGNGGSLIIAQEVATKAPPGAVILGVNLDTDQAAARKLAAASALPGIQVYDAAGANSALARDLKLVLDNTVLITNREGLITSVSARPDLAPRISTAAQ